MLALRLPPDIEERLGRLSELTGRSKSFYAREAILEHLDDIEDAYLSELRLRDNPEFIDFDDAMKELGLEMESPDQ